MIRKALKIVAPLVVLALAVVVALRILDSSEDPPTQARRAPPPLVRSLVVTLSDEALLVQSQGTVTPAVESLLTPEVSGRIEWVAPAFVTGGFFEQGAALLRLDSRNHEIAVVLARAEVARAELSLELEIQEAAVATAEWSALEEEQAPALVAREPQLAWVRSELAAAGARLALAELDLERTVIRAPFAGRVAARNADIGQVVAQGTTLARLHGVDRAEVRLPVADRDLAFLDLDLSFSGTDESSTNVPLTLFSEFAGQRWSWAGRIVRSEGEIDAATRMVHLVAGVDDPYGRRGEQGPRPPLAVGLFVTAQLHGRVAEDVVVLPRSALRSTSTVAVIDKDGRLRFRDVVVWRVERERALISAGLRAGERVCLSTLEAAVEGMLVRIDDEVGAGP